jgi:hypothetical protein
MRYETKVVGGANRENAGSLPSVITSGASWPVRPEAYWRQRAGMGERGSMGHPAASARTGRHGNCGIPSCR